MDIVKFESEDKKKEKQDKMFDRISVMGVMAEIISKKILKEDIQKAYDRGFKEGYEKGRSED